MRPPPLNCAEGAIPFLGGTGYQPVPPGNLPDGMTTTFNVQIAVVCHTMLPPIPPGW